VWRTELAKIAELAKETPDERLGLVWCAEMGGSDKKTR